MKEKEEAKGKKKGKKGKKSGKKKGKKSGKKGKKGKKGGGEEQVHFFLYIQLTLDYPITCPDI